MHAKYLVCCMVLYVAEAGSLSVPALNCIYTRQIINRH